MIYLPFWRMILTSDIGPLNGISVMLIADEAASPANESGSIDPS